MEIIISQENPYKAIFDQIDEANKSVWYKDIKIYCKFDYDLNKELTDSYIMSFPWTNYRAKDFLNEEEASKILVLLDFIGYRHKRYKYE